MTNFQFLEDLVEWQNMLLFVSHFLIVCPWEGGHLTAKSDTRVGHLNAFLAQGGGHLTKPIFKSSNARGVARGGMLNFRIDRRITPGNMLPGGTF